MTNNKTTKRALLASIVSLVLCFSMLLGTTYAWFTDSAATASNVITAGNLDIEVTYTLDGVTWNNLDGAKDLFQKDLWEPGHTEVVALRIKNNGTLALKYAANMNIVNETVGKTKDGADIVLSDILTVSTTTQEAVDANGNANQVGDIFLALAFNGENKVAYENTASFKAGNVLRADQNLAPGAAHYMIVKVDMAETVGNEANHNGTNIPTINFGINVLATQYTSESDSFNNQYDKDATYETKAEENHTCTYDSTDVCTVCGIIQYKFDAAKFDLLMGTNTATATDVVIPETFEHDGKKYKVTSLPRSAFHGCASLTSVVIPDSVTTIGSYAFYQCSSLKNITIPDSVTTIGTAAFSGCSSLESIVIPDGITQIGGNAFLDCSSMTSITIPDSVVSIGNSAFLRCNSLVTVNYKGSAEQWAAIVMEGGNDCLINATINYNYTGE